MDSEPPTLPPPYTLPANPLSSPLPPSEKPPSLTYTIRLSTQDLDLDLDLQEAHLSDPPPHYDSSATPRYERYARPQLRHPSCTARTNPNTENLAAPPPQLQVQEHVGTEVPPREEDCQSVSQVSNANGMDTVPHEPALEPTCAEEEEIWAELFVWRKRTNMLVTLCVFVVVLVAGLAFASTRCGLFGSGDWFR